jgi:hypothetical protein
MIGYAKKLIKLTEARGGGEIYVNFDNVLHVTVAKDADEPVTLIALVGGGGIAVKESPETIENKLGNG